MMDELPEDATGQVDELPAEPADERIGQWVQITLGGETIYTGGHAVVIGVLRDADAGFLYVESRPGEMACLPREAVWDVRVVPPMEPAAAQ